MKKRITALALACVMVMGTVAAAAGVEKTITVTPMEMSVNGCKVTPTDAKGAEAEVFAYNGTTYAPVRYLCELLGIDVAQGRPGHREAGERTQCPRRGRQARHLLWAGPGLWRSRER